MSGPKVVRIVTREEIVAVCEGLLAQLDAALEEWIRVGRRNETLADAEITASRARRDGLRRLLAEDRFLELQKAAPAEIAFLANDQQARLTRAAAVRAEARSAARRTGAVCSSILSALDRAGADVPADLRRELEEGAAGRADGTAAVTKGFRLLSAREAPMVTEHQRRLASAHKGVDDRQGYDEWLASQPKSAEDEDVARLDSRIAELAVLLGDAATAAFEDRLRKVASDASSRRSMLVDALQADLAHAVFHARERRVLETRLRLLAAELTQAASEPCEALARSIAGALDGPSESLLLLEKEGRELLGRVRSEAAAEARRRAVLRGLVDLGYQVSEGLETAWAKDGRVVLRRPSQPGYGVELAGKGDLARVQMRAVAIRDAAGGGDTDRDRDAETLFCGDVARLSEQFAAAGGDVVIERALPIGAAPLKVVTDETGALENAGRAELLSAPRKRTIR